MDSNKGKANILLAEDNLLNQELTRVLLTRLGYRCHPVGNGLLALEALRANHFDLLLLDMQMPIMDGLETIHAIRKDPELSKTPVIALTANTLGGDKQRYLDAGCDDYISKPIESSDVAEKIEEVLARYR